MITRYVLDLVGRAVEVPDAEAALAEHWLGAVRLAVTFDPDPAGREPFVALGALEGWVVRRSWSLGRNQGRDPIGVHAERGVDVQKWRNLESGDRRRLAGLALWSGEDPRFLRARLYVRGDLDCRPTAARARAAW